MIRVIIHIILFSLCFSVYCQELKTNLDKEEIQIGEPFKLTYAIISEEPIDSILYQNQEVVFNARTTTDNNEETDLSYELELLTAFTDTTYQEDGNYIWKGIYELTGWDSAYVIIPSEKIQLLDSTYWFEAKIINVSRVSADPSIDIYDINEEFTEIEEEKSKFNFWLWILIAAVLVVVIILVLRKLKKQDTSDPISLLDRTIEAISKLEKSKKYEEDLKEYYFDLSIILRQFLSEYYNQRLMDKTTSEIIALLSIHKMKSATIDTIKMLLTKSDMVKFAKSRPPISDVFIVTDTARNIVRELGEHEIKSQEE